MRRSRWWVVVSIVGVVGCQDASAPRAERRQPMAPVVSRGQFLPGTANATLEWLADPPGYWQTVANGINASGVVVGTGVGGPGSSLTHGIVFDLPRAIVDLTPDPGAWYEAFNLNAVNDLGIAAGSGFCMPWTCGTPAGNGFAVTYNAVATIGIYMPTMPDVSATQWSKQAVDINNHGDVVGNTYNSLSFSGIPYGAALWPVGGGAVDLDDPTGGHSFATAIAPNLTGAQVIVVGWDQFATPQGWIYQNGQKTYLPEFRQPEDVTDNGWIVGAGGASRAQLLRNGVTIGLDPFCLADLPTASQVSALAIAMVGTNPARAVIVGQCGQAPYVWYDDGQGNFDGEFLPTYPGDDLGIANDVNASGQIVGYTAPSTDQTNHHSLRWTFTPPPLSAAPVAVAGGPYTENEGAVVSFDGSQSSDPNNDPLSYSWDFGDGSTPGSGATPTHTYVQNGTYTATLTVTDPGALASSSTATVTIANAAPAPDAGPDRTVVAKRSLAFSAAFTDAGALDQPWTLTVQWGDGTANATRQATTQGTQASFSHTYNTPGTYNRTLTVTDKDGGTASDVAVITVQANAPPDAVVTGPYTGTEGTAVAMSSTGTADPNGDVLTYSWRFGDGTTSTAASPNKTYADNGTFTVTLIVKDPSGAADTATTTATIGNVAPTASFAAPTSVTEGVAISLALNNATDRGTADRASLQYAFDCGQGGGLSPFSSTKSVSCPAEVDQRTALSVVGQVRDKDGSVTSYTKSVSITNAAPVVTLSATSATTFVVGNALSVQGAFTDKGVNDQPWSYSLGWGDGSAPAKGTVAATGSLPPLSHTYLKAGTYGVQLVVTDKDGLRGSSVRITVVVTP